MTVIIPAYKPDEKLLRLIDQLQEQNNLRILVVNDGSGEAFEPIFRGVAERGVLILRHPENRGKGAALKTAFSFLLEEGCQDVICTADADGQHLVKDILRCLEEAKAHPDALVLGGRGFRGNVPFRSRFGNAVSRWTFALLMRKRVYDTQTGLRAFSHRLLPDLLTIEANRYEYEMQMLCNAVRKKVPIREIEIETVYLEENRSSHFNPLKDALRVYGLLFRCAFGKAFQIISFLFSSLLAVLIDLSVLYVLFHWVLYPLLPGEDGEALRYGLSLFFARGTSSAVNYMINRKVVFANLKNPARTFTLYILLVIFIFFANCALGILFLELGLHVLLSETLAQTLCFPISFFIQKFLIFRKSRSSSRS